MIVRCSKHITPPKRCDPLTSHKSPLRYNLETTRAQHKAQKYKICKLTFTYLITQASKLEAQHIQQHARYKTKTCKGASNFQCKQIMHKLPQGGTLDIR